MADVATERIDRLIERGEDQGCVNLSELSEAIQEGRAAARGVDKFLMGETLLP